jgi:5,10-methylenetetrahydromethanopterin reductase
MFTAARPVQEHLPLKIAAMGGPKSFEFAGEVADGMHHACGYSRENYDYVVDHVKAGARKAGRNPDDLDIGAWLIWSCGPDSKAAKEAARIMAAFYIPAMPQNQVERHGIDYESLQPISDAFASGDVGKALELTTPELGERLSVAGTPEECVEKLKSDIIPPGINHVICSVTDAFLVKHFSGQDLDNVPDVPGQLRLIHDEVMPAFN